jgi:hypothetical protein
MCVRIGCDGNRALNQKYTYSHIYVRGKDLFVTKSTDDQKIRNFLLISYNFLRNENTRCIGCIEKTPTRGKYLLEFQVNIETAR